MNKIIFSEEQIQQIILLHNEGLYNREIAQKFKVSTSVISRILQKTDLPSRHPLLSQERKDEIIKFYVSTLNAKLTCKEMHVNDKTLAMLCKDYNVHKLNASEAKIKQHINQNYFDEMNTCNKFYIFGLLCADGTVSSKGNTISISLQENDVDILLKIKKELELYDLTLAYKNMKDKNPNFQNQYTLSISNKHIHDLLISYGCMPNKTNNFVFPSIVSNNFLKDFLRGYFDGDGNIAKKEKRVKLIGRVDFINNLKNLIENNLSIHCSIIYSKKSDNYVDLQIAGRIQCKKFLDWIYADSELYIKRKYDLYKQIYI